MPLGRGLGSLIPPKNTTKTSDLAPAKSELIVNAEDSRDKIWRVPVAEITANTTQPRHHFADAALADLAESIREHGILQPLVMIKRQSGYELIAGERRLRAAKLAGLKEVPAIIRDVDEQRKLELALIENLQRENLNAIEVAKSINQLMEEFGLTQDLAAKRLGKSRSAVANSLRLLTLSEDIQQAIIAGKISEGHGKILAGLENEVQRQVMFKKILANDLSVAETAVLSKGKKSGSPKTKVGQESDQVFIDELSGILAAKTSIKRSKVGGQIVINFFSDDELQGIVKKITK